MLCMAETWALNCHDKRNRCIPNVQVLKNTKTPVGKQRKVKGKGIREGTGLTAIWGHTGTCTAGCSM